jgi:hypothetical protein
MSTMVIRAVLLATVVAPLLVYPAEARASQRKVLKCNADGTYTCGYTCNDSRFCCEMHYL